MSAGHPSSALVEMTWKMNPATKCLDQVTLHVSAGAMELRHGGEILARVDFANTAKIVTFKRDLFTTDVICVVFVDRAGNGVIVHEEMPGFGDPLDALPAEFAGIDREWYAKVMQPPFATNETTLWPPPAT